MFFLGSHGVDINQFLVVVKFMVDCFLTARERESEGGRRL